MDAAGFGPLSLTGCEPGTKVKGRLFLRNAQHLKGECGLFLRNAQHLKAKSRLFLRNAQDLKGKNVTTQVPARI
ncbi:hypothetical protein B9T62_21355 [Paenibacillus donghaensis]|uniref:Uncharacterized protein n=1 Tax=Paenibacillus donghaensis TaxID=414771 RepID=A0A2Z2KIK1_9BACL|nr:hypothetical protein B9T62_21355 [Paenibacillus donghaensis]